MGILSFKLKNTLSLVFFSIPYYLLFAGTIIVLILYIYLYRALNKTLNRLAFLVAEFQSPKLQKKQEIKHPLVRQEVKDENEFFLEKRENYVSLISDSEKGMEV